MKPSYRLLAALAVLSLATLACSLNDKISINLPTKATAEVTSETGSETTTELKLLFEDDFSKTSSGWDRYSDDTSITDYLDGVYQIKVLEANWYTWSNPGKTFGDVVVEVDGWKADGPDGDLAIICRYQNESNFYLLGITTDGYYGITKIKDGDDTLLGSEYLEYSGLIDTQAGAVNHIRADCIGNSLTLYVNGEVLADVSDSDFSNGDVGLAGGTYDEGGSDMRFDNFVVYRP
jgi:hypothetical protein